MFSCEFEKLLSPPFLQNTCGQLFQILREAETEVIHNTACSMSLRKDYFLSTK